MPENRRMFWKVRATLALPVISKVRHALEQEAARRRCCVSVIMPSVGL